MNTENSKADQSHIFRPNLSGKLILKILTETLH